MILQPNKLSQVEVEFRVTLGTLFPKPVNRTMHSYRWMSGAVPLCKSLTCVLLFLNHEPRSRMKAWRRCQEGPIPPN